MAALLLDALTAAVSDLAVGLVLAGIAAVTIFVCIRWEVQEARKELEAEQDEVKELADVWSFPPKWSPSCAESDLGDVSERRAA